uniref:hypothetical protein n=1 Tax=Nocardiopsis deserti TaxID=2605988 RepID=UPI001680A702|nr:hypothetical protein [Nocardiopsis deserti]
MTQDLDSLARALYAGTERLLKHRPDLAPWRPEVGFRPRLSDTELVTPALTQALLGHASEARWLRYTRTHLSDQFPCLPQQPGYDKRLRKVPTLIRHPATDTATWTDDARAADSTPVERARSRETVKRSDLAG